jgi:2-amino-4-hydroxy-6-hydroxymethyldihydropteridine diphosphokinase
MRKAAAMLRRMTTVLAFSTCWETPAVGSDGEPAAAPRFLNAAACIATPLSPDEIKAVVITPLEHALGRVRGPDKYAPRTIDLDITIYEARVLDEALWQRAYLALIFAELLPELRSPHTGESLSHIAERWKRSGLAVPRPDIYLGD